MFSCGKLIFAGGRGVAPGVPRNLSGYGMVRSVWLEFSAPLVLGSDRIGDLPVLWYLAQMSSDGGATWQDVEFFNTVSAEFGGTGRIPRVILGPEDGLDPAITYCFRVAAANKFGTSGWTDPFCVKPKAGPEAPTNVRAFRYRGWRSIGLFSPLRVFVDWDVPSSDMEVRGYIVEMKEGDQNWGDKPTNFGTVTYEAAAQTSGTLAEDILNRYASDDSVRQFRVKADTGGGYGPWSAPVTVQDGLGMSPGPVDWSAVGGNVTIFWTPPSDTKGYTLSGYVVSLASPGAAKQEVFVTGTSTVITRPVPSSGTIELRARYLNGPDVNAVPSSRSQVTL